LHRSLPAFCFLGGAHTSPCTAHFRRPAFQAVRTSLLAPLISGILLFGRCALLFLHRPFPAFCFSGGAHISPCTAHFRRSAFQAVLISLLAPLTSNFLFSGGAHISPCTAHF